MVLLPEDLDRLQGTAQPGGLASPLLPNDLDAAVKNIRATSDIKSPQAIQAIKASRDTGLSSNVTLADPQSVQLRQMERGMRAALTDAPKTASLMSGDPMRAAAVKEDYESLSLLERLLQGGNPMIDNEFNFAEDTGFGGTFASAAKQISRAVPSFAKSTNEILAMGAGALDSAERGLGNVLGSGSTGVFGNARDWLLGQSEWINKNILQDPSLMLPKEKQGQLLKSEGGWKYSWDRPELLLDPEWLTFNAGEVASSMAPMLAATYATGGSTLVGALVGSGQEAGDLYRELVMDGNDPDKALTAATLFGVGVGWLNKVGLDKMLDKTVATTLFKRAAKSLTAGTVEGITEYLEEPLQAMTKGWAEQKSFPEIAADVQASLANIDVIPGSILFGGGVSYSTHYKAEYQRAKFSESEQKFLDQIDQAAATPQMAQHDPLLYQETLRVLKDGGKVTHVYIPAQALGSLYSGEGLSKIVDSLGVREQYGDMAEVGGDLKVEIGDYIKTVAADPNFAPTIVNDRRLSEDGFTRNELTTMQKEQAQEFQAVLDVVKNEREAESAIEAEGQQIYKQVVEMRRASGMVSASVTADAAQMAAFYTTMAKRSDGQYTPLQLFERFGPSEVRGAPMAQTGDLRQDSPALAGVDMNDAAQVAEAQRMWAEKGVESPYFKKWSGGAAVVDGEKHAQGPGVMRLFHGTDAPGIAAFEIGRKAKRFVGMADLDVESQGVFLSPSGEDAGGYGKNVGEYLVRVDKVLADPMLAEDPNKAREEIFYILEPEMRDGYIDADGGVSSIEVDTLGVWINQVFQNGLLEWSYLDNPEVVRRLKELGYNAVRVYEANDQSGMSWFVTDPTQIKSVFNRGTFDASDPRILMQGADRSAVLQQYKKDPNVFWHGSPSGSLVGAANGIHVGTYRAAEEALNARIGIPATGYWDGTRAYGETLLAGKKRMKELGEYPTGFSVDAPEEDYYPGDAKSRAKYSGGQEVDFASRPVISPVKIVGEMSNHRGKPMADFKANGQMSAMKKRGIAKRGYFYTNDGEDAGSISAVVPSREHLEEMPLPGSGQTLFQSAYHGSPYRFDKFSLEHIGSGEGAQAYGYGLYFAGEKEVAEFYREALTERYDKVTVRGEILPDQSGDVANAVRIYNQDGGDFVKWKKATASRMRSAAENGPGKGRPERARELRAAADFIEGLKKADLANKGQLYEVTIPDDDTMLDWDKPLSEQPEQVKRAFRAAYSAAEGDFKKVLNHSWDSADPGEALYRDFSSLFGSDRAASEYLKSIGIPGLRYLDGTSRGKGEGHHNYVIFDDAQIAIDKTYYQKPLASEVNQGAVTFNGPSGRPIIDLFTKANASTFLHESGHTYFEAIKRMAADPVAPEQIKQTWAAAQAGLYKLADSAATRANTRGDLGTITGDDVRAFIDGGMAQNSPKNRAAYIGVQEEWARQIEAYFMEGKTPNLELRTVFQKFKDWLRAIYENFSALGMAEPSAELKPVFDRIFATDQQIAEAESFYIATKPFLDQGFEMAEEDRKAYLDRVNKAKETANDARMRKLAKAYIQALGGKDEFTKAATEEINASPIYKAMDETLTEGGYSREAVEAIVGKEAATALSKRRRGLVTKDGAEPVLRPGFDSLPAMLNAMMSAPTKKDAIKNSTETKIAQERKFLEQMIHDDNVLPGDEDYHNDDRLALLHAEFILLSKRVKGRELAAKMRDAQLEVAAVREAARQAITKMTASTATSPSKFARQERKAAKEAFLAKTKGDMAAMAAAKRKEMLNHALFMEAAIAREQMEKLERGARRLVNSKSMKRESRALAERLSIQFGLHRPTRQRTASAEWADYRARLAVEEKEIPTVMAWSEAMYELGYDVAFDPFILTTQEPLDYKTLTWGQVLAVREALNIIHTIDKNERTVFLNGQRIALEEMRAQLAAGLDPVLTKEKPAPKPGSPYIDKPGIKGLVKGIHANHLKLEAILQRLDGWKTGGIWWNTFFRPVAGAEDARSLRLKQVAADLKEMFALYAKKKGDLFNKQILIPALGRSFTKSQLLAVALNTGNEGNLLRLAKGEGWTTLDQNGRDTADMQKIMAVLQPLEKQDWDFVQKVWNYLDTFRPEAFALEERLTGKTPERVEAKPVETPFGQYAGGYYPAVYDADRSYTTFSRAQAEDDKSLFGRNHGSSQTKHNHLKARAQNGGDQKVSLDLGVLSEHLFTVVHDITHREPLLEVAKLVRDKEISKMIEDTLGKEVYREFMPWLQDIARERMVPPFTRLERLAAWARKGTTMMSLGLKMTTIITQPFGLTQTFEALGPSYTMRGISTVYRNLPDMHRTITEKSVFMANRLENFDREVRDSMKGVTGFQDKKKAVEKFAYYGIGMAQMGVDLPTWWGGYQKGLSEFSGDEAKAVAYADSVVRLSQSSGATKDLSRVQRGPELQRMFTMFYSYFNMLYNLAYRAGTRFRGDHNIPRAAASAMLLWFLPAILTELATGRGPDDDEGEEWMSWAGTKLAMYPMNMIVGLRDLTNAIGSGFDYQTTPAAGAPASIVKWVKAVNKAIEEDEPERLIKPTVEMIGFAAHLPLKQVEITVGNVWDYMTGEDPDFQIRDLLFTKQKSRR